MHHQAYIVHNMPVFCHIKYTHQVDCGSRIIKMHQRRMICFHSRGRHEKERVFMDICAKLMRCAVIIQAIHKHVSKYFKHASRRNTRLSKRGNMITESTQQRLKVSCFIFIALRVSICYRKFFPYNRYDECGVTI